MTDYVPNEGNIYIYIYIYNQTIILRQVIYLKDKSKVIY